jgi:hypothetical protein
MMKIEIYGEEEKKEEPLRLRLIKSKDGVFLAAVDEDGKPLATGFLLEITTEGFRRLNWRSDKVGLPLDKYGRVVIYPDESNMMGSLMGLPHEKYNGIWGRGQYQIKSN